MVQIDPPARKPAELLQLNDMAPSHAAAALFESITGVDSHDLDGIFGSQAVMPQDVSARGLRDNLAELLGISKAAAADLLDTSPSRLSRSDRIDLRMLDRAHAVIRTFVTVAAVVGPHSAADWLKRPSVALDQRAPLQLLGSSYGEKRVENLIDGLLGGAIV